MGALVAMERYPRLSAYMQSADGLVLYRPALDKLVRLGLAMRSGERGNYHWTATDAGRDRVAQWDRECA
jgi:hypothetical protein